MWAPSGSPGILRLRLVGKIGSHGPISSPEGTPPKSSCTAAATSCQAGSMSSRQPSSVSCNASLKGITGETPLRGFIETMAQVDISVNYFQRAGCGGAPGMLMSMQTNSVSLHGEQRQ